MSDQTNDGGNVEVSPSRGMEDYFGEMPEQSDTETNDQTDTADTKEVKSDQTDDNKNGAEDTKENDSESKKETEDKKTTETKKEDGEDDSNKSDKKDEKDKEDAQPSEFEVAGTKYSTIDDAIKAVNRINGDNTRLSGDVKSLRREKLELSNSVSKLENLLQDYKSANEEWQKYYDGEGEKPDNTKANLEELIDKKVKEVKDSEKELERKVQFDAEFDEIFAEDDFDKVEPVFKKIVEEYEGSKNPPNPKKLYKRARTEYKESLGENELKDIDSIEDMVNERVQKILAKKEAVKQNSDTGGAGENPSNAKKLPPEVADYMAQYIGE